MVYEVRQKKLHECWIDIFSLLYCLLSSIHPNKKRENYHFISYILIYIHPNNTFLSI